MLSHSLLHQRSFALDRNQLRLPAQLETIGESAKVKTLPLEVIEGRVYKYAPPGGAVLSLPFVAIAGWLRLKPVDSEGSYSARRELHLSATLAAVLMAIFVVACFYLANLVLPLSWSLAVAICAAFGTQVWSTASRVLEPDTWAILLIFSAVTLLLASELGDTRSRPALLASLLAWSYFVHPTTAIPIAGITGFLGIYRRKDFLPFALTGAFWLLLFVVFSRLTFGQVLPNYYQPGRLGFQTFAEALPGNLISPSRGLLVYVPLLAAIGFLLLRYRRVVPHKRLVALGLIILTAHWVMISGFEHWWAGHSYGPRYWTSMVPWFVLLGILGTRGLLNQPPDPLRRDWKTKTGILVLASLSIFIHARGALSEETRLWNARPFDIDLRAGRLWDWSYPQFLAGLIHPPLPPGAYAEPPLSQKLDMTSPVMGQYLWYGWSDAEPEIRWTEARRSALVFALNKPIPLKLVIKAHPFLVSGLIDSQRVTVNLNGIEVQSLTLTSAIASELTITLAEANLKRENIIVFDFRDAQSPESFGLSTDRRLLGLAVHWIEFRTGL